MFIQQIPGINGLAFRIPPGPVRSGWNRNPCFHGKQRQDFLHIGFRLELLHLLRILFHPCRSVGGQRYFLNGQNQPVLKRHIPAGETQLK